MFGQQEQDIRIYVIERDIYARHAIAGYLSLDRRTRVLGQCRAPHELLAALHDDPALKRLDAVVLDTAPTAAPAELVALIRLILTRIPHAALICLAHTPDREAALAAGRAGARAFLVRESVGVALADAICYAADHEFVVTQDVARTLGGTGAAVGRPVEVLPGRRHYPRLTGRVEQALWLCVVEGLPADRAAEEMGVSTHTVRSYVKEGYRILEAADDTVFPAVVSPAERAFLRYTSLDGERDQPAA
jgi:DNA-binding NarL/FixJ family response regulator